MIGRRGVSMCPNATSTLSGPTSSCNSQTPIGKGKLTDPELVESIGVALVEGYGVVALPV